MKRVAALQAAWLLTQARSARRFRAALSDPEAAQQSRLQTLVGALSGARYGQHVGLAGVRTFDDLQRIPVVDAATVEPWVRRIASGETGVLTTEPVEVLEPTGGSTGGTRMVPTTARLRAEFAAAVAPWMHDLHRRSPGLFGTRQYWSISRAVRRQQRTEGGVPIGFPDDAAYFGPLERWAIRRMQAVPGEVAGLSSTEAWRAATAIHLIEAADLGLISVWSPTFLTVLLMWMATHRQRLAVSLSAEAERRFRSAWGPHGIDGRRLWPRLQVVSAWADGFAASHVPALRARFPGVRFQAKGLLATEGVVSVPYGPTDAAGHVLALTAHVLELADPEDTTNTVRPHEAQMGGVYQPLLTTGGGFVRYALPDAVQVVGFEGRVPRIRLLGRLDRGSDRVGEKLTEGFVQRVVDTVASGCGFAMLVPAELGYTLVVDTPGVDAGALEDALCAAYHYRYARELGQLTPAEVMVRPNAWGRWERGIEAARLGLGDQKPGPLETRGAVVEALLSDE